MATNPHIDFRGPPSEMQLAENLVIESIKFFGVDVTYIPRTITSTNDILNEVVHSTFEKGFVIEAKIEGIDSHSASSMIFDKLGLGFSVSTISVFISKKRFQEEVPDEQLEYPDRPNPGDLIFIPHVKLLLEIKDADPENLVKSGGRLHVYELKCDIFKSSTEPMAKDGDFINDLRETPDFLKGAPNILSDDIEVDDEGNIIQDPALVVDNSDLGDNEDFLEAGNNLLAEPSR